MTEGGPARLQWYGSWGASPQPVSPGFVEPPTIEDQTVRQVLRLSLGGSQVRLRLSNAHSNAPLVIGAVRVALAAAEGTIDPESDRAVCFAGANTVTLRQGETVVSDPIELELADRTRLAVSLFLPGRPVIAAWHATGLATAYLSEPGDHTGDETFPVAGTFEQRLVVAGVDVVNDDAKGAIVCFGDSVTDGAGSSANADCRWPDRLAGRLATRDGAMRYGIVNAGISGSRLLRDVIGLRGLKRFERDVLSVPGAKYVTLLYGNNDLGFPHMPDDAPLAEVADRAPVKAADIIEGQQKIVAMAHERGLKILGATLPPFVGAPFFDAANADDERLAVNEWIRHGGAFDALVDFDTVLRDPADPSRLKPEFDSGDHLHPSDAGYQAMAEAIDLTLFP
jgi:lysophospholipase L1-like esterase